MKHPQVVAGLACALMIQQNALSQVQVSPRQTLFNTNVRYFAPTFDDYNADGVQDFVGYNISSQSVDLVNGATGGLMRRYSGVEQNSNIGIRIATIPDADGDGRRDTVIAGESDVWALKSSGGSGAVGSVPRLYSIHAEVVGPFIAVAGPVTMLASGDNSRVMLVDTVTGVVRARITNDGAGLVGTLGQSAVNLGDINGDGLPDFASSGGNVNHGGGPAGSVFVISSNTTTAGSGYTQMSSLGPSQRLSEMSGRLFLGAGSTTGQGNTSVNLGDPNPNDGQLQSIVLSGAPWGNSGGLAAHVLTAGSGGTVMTTTVASYDHTASGLFGTCVEDVGDVNGDGVHDAALLDAAFQISNQRAGAYSDH